MQPLRFRSIWISDVHLGTKGCRADFLLDFLNATQSEHLYLVGDIIDIWSLKSAFFWPQAHNDVVRAVIEKARQGTQVVYVPGNHDEVFRDYAGMVVAGLSIQREAIHETADGRRLLILHGDEFDSVVQCSPMLAVLGSRAYDWLLSANRGINYIRRRFGFPYWSLAAYLKYKVKNAVNYIGSFEHAVAHAARKRGVDGLVCGHIHRAEISWKDGVLYCNDGDWVESCTSLVERYDGTLHLLHWSDEQQTLKTACEVFYEETGHAA